MLKKVTMKVIVSSAFLLLLYIVICSAEFHEVNSQRIRSRRHRRSIEWGPDVAGPYCETRSGGCCPGRIDKCAVPILGTLCYCDNFCNRTRGDCCPDFFSYCRGIKPSTTEPPRADCEYRNKYYPPDTRVTDNCRDCKCSPDPLQPGKYKFRCSGDVCLIRAEVINGVNGGNYGWRASNYSSMWGLTLREGMKYKLGTHKPSDSVRNMNPIRVFQNERLPVSFDAREKWRGFVHDVRDQGNCGASWAFSTTSLAADRLAIESKGALMDTLSPQQLLSCNRHGQTGCEGGHLDRAWWYLRRKGVTTEDCYPYVSGDLDSQGKCMVGHRFQDRRCPSGVIFREKKVYQVTPPYRIAMTEQDIMAELYSNGPVQATFNVKDDFFMYISGVYRYTGVGGVGLPDWDEARRYHSVRIIGWGEERPIYPNRAGTKYWLCANSWGRDWGEQGHFRIVRGQNECDIESFVIGVWGKVEGDPVLRNIIFRSRQERRRERHRLEIN